MNELKKIADFVGFCARNSIKGGEKLWYWIFFLTFFISMGAFTYYEQFTKGLVVTGMSDQVSWGLYVSNFTYLVGVAAAAVMLVIPAYIFHNPEAKRVVILGEGLAVAACVMCITFVTVDMGHPERVWHMMPYVGKFNWPASLLTWDVIVLTVYLLLNLLLPAYILYHDYHGTKANKKFILGVALLSMFWAISIHTITAFLFVSNTTRPFWHSALSAPRFLASAFTSGPAFIIIAFSIMHKLHIFKIGHKVIDMLAVIVAIAMQINLVMLMAELFTEFYNAGAHSASAHYLFLGLDGYTKLVPWIWTAITFNIIAAVLLMWEKTRTNDKTLLFACSLAVVGVWIEKGMGFVIPGFIPTPIGEIFEYGPNIIEVKISLGILALGMLIFTLMMNALATIKHDELGSADAPY